MALKILADAIVLASHFINKSQANVTPANDEDRVGKLEADGKMDDWFIKHVVNLDTYEQINGATTPQAVLKAGDGTLLLSKTDIDGKKGFFGLVKKNYSAQTPATSLGSAVTSAGVGNVSFTLNAGTNRLVMVFIPIGFVGTTAVPTGVTWNGNTMIQLLNSQGSYSGMSIWYYKAGTSGSSQTGNVVVTGGTAVPQSGGIIARGYQYVDQTNPFQDSDINFFTSGNGTSITSVSTQAYAYSIQAYAARNGNTTTYDSEVPTQSQISTSHGIAEGPLYGIREIVMTTSHTGGAFDAIERGIAACVILKNATITTAEVHHEGIVNGFTGLTKGAEYRISATAGAIVNTGDGMKIGTAISTTEILIQRPRMRASGVVSYSGGTLILPCGFRPSVIRATGGSNNANYGGMSGTWINGVYAGVYGNNSTALFDVFSDALLKIATAPTFSVTVTVSDTGFSLGFSGSGTAYFFWEAEE